MCINLKKYLNNSDDFSYSFIKKNNSIHNKILNFDSKIKLNLLSKCEKKNNKNLPFINNIHNKSNLDMKSFYNKILNNIQEKKEQKNNLTKSLSQRNFKRIQLFQSPKKINKENNQFFKKIKKYKIENSFQQKLNNLLYKFDDNYMNKFKKLKDNKNIQKNFDISDYHKKFIDISKDKIDAKNIKILKNNLENLNEKIKYNKKIFHNKWDIFYNKIEHIAPFNLLKKIKSLSNKKRKYLI
jgi:uncharacterized protein YbgA (DUF1722 family)